MFCEECYRINKKRERESPECDIHLICTKCGQPERSKREDTFIYKPENYPGPIAIDCKPSKECDEYHKNAKVQINIKSDSVL